MVKVKICGITNVRDARAVVRLGADALGFNFYAPSPRYIRPERARAIIAALPPFVAKVGVFVNEDVDKVNEIVQLCGLDVVQLHGDESPRNVERVRVAQRIKGVRVADEDDIALCRRYRVDAYLLDAFVPGMPGGTGETFNWRLAREARQFGPVILAGGLNPDNIEDAIRSAQPYAVDVASGVESEPGVKDRDLVEAFILRAKATLV